jgi:hypothetical protein
MILWDFIIEDKLDLSVADVRSRAEHIVYQEAMLHLWPEYFMRLIDIDHKKNVTYYRYAVEVDYEEGRLAIERDSEAAKGTGQIISTTKSKSK